jgi:hypothetical protein
MEKNQNQSLIYTSQQSWVFVHFPSAVTKVWHCPLTITDVFAVLTVDDDINPEAGDVTPDSPGLKV